MIFKVQEAFTYCIVQQKDGIYCAVKWRKFQPMTNELIEIVVVTPENKSPKILCKMIFLI